MTDTFAGNATLGERFTAFRTNWAESRARYTAYKITKTELDALSNRDLADLGLSRSMIKRTAIDAAYGK